MRRCQANGEWSGSEPSCSRKQIDTNFNIINFLHSTSTAVDCGGLPHPQNGWVHISPNTLLGAEALYRCKLGFELSSKVKRRCQANGKWSGSAPTCNGML